MRQAIHQVVHGYHRGHSLLGASSSLPKSALETIAEQSDLSGPVPSGVSIPVYITTYPVPDTGLYALAKTWPDENAPRSGCVITHTLLIPLQLWQSIANPSSLLRLHRQPDRESLVSFKTPLFEDEAPKLELPNRINPREADEFAAKIFDEGLRSVVWFDCDAPDTLTMSLASMLWPSMRSSLYACGFSLHSQATVKCDLQLHFAPRGAQSYFSRIPKQCHMGTRSHKNTGEHGQEWLSEISEDLHTGQPRPSYRSSLSQFGHLLGPDPSAVRTLFVLRDLTQRVPEVPSAALGILDIIDSLQPNTEDSQEEKQHALSAAIASASKAEATTALHWLSLIDARLKRPSFAGAGASIHSLFGKTVASIVSAEPQAIISASERGSPVDDSLFWRSVARGLNIAASKSPKALRVLRKSPTVAASVIRVEPALASEYLETAGDSRAEAVLDVAEWFRQTESPHDRRQLRRELLPVVVDSEGLPLLVALLRDIGAEEVGETLETLVHGSHGFSNEDVRQATAEYVSHRFPYETTEWGRLSEAAAVSFLPEVLAEAFELSEKGMELLLAVDWASGTDRCEVFSAFIRRSDHSHFPQWLVRRAAHDVSILEPFEFFSPQSTRSTEALRSLAKNCDYIPLARSLALDGTLLRIGETELVDSFSSRAIDSAIVEHIAGQIHDDRMASLLALPLCERAHISREHIQGLLSLTADRESWQRSWITTAILPPRIFGIAVDQSLISGFVHNFRAFWTENVAESWARILRRSEFECHFNEGLRLKRQATSFCLNSVRLPLGKVISEAFPAIYKTVNEAGAPHITDEMFGYFEWDKAKRLRKDLIDAYMASSWPAEELAFIASNCQILGKVIHRLQRKWGGDIYTRKMIDALGAMDSKEGNRLRSEIVAYVNDPDFFEPWD